MYERMRDGSMDGRGMDGRQTHNERTDDDVEMTNDLNVSPSFFPSLRWSQLLSLSPSNLNFSLRQ